ncbi:hypothetical protein ACWX0K_07065 [Nitrobacteraceae bacterium UC4446_H13]
MVHRQIVNREWLGEVAGDTAPADASLAAVVFDVDNREDNGPFTHLIQRTRSALFMCHFVALGTGEEYRIGA